MNKGKFLIAAASAAVCAAGITAITVVVCKRIFEKHYFSVND